MSVESTNSLASPVSATAPFSGSGCYQAQSLSSERPLAGPLLSQGFNSGETVLQQTFVLSPSAQLISSPGAESLNSALLPAVADKLLSLLERFVGVVEKAVEFFINREKEKKIAAEPETAGSASSTTSSASETEDKPPASEVKSGTAPGSSSKSFKKGEPLLTNKNFYYRPQFGKSKTAEVLLPKELKDQISSVKILSADYKTLLDEGKADGVTIAKRPRYKFSKKGSTLPKGAVVQIKLKTGELKDVVLGDTSKSQRK